MADVIKGMELLIKFLEKGKKENPDELVAYFEAKSKEKEAKLAAEALKSAAENPQQQGTGTTQATNGVTSQKSTRRKRGPRRR